MNLKVSIPLDYIVGHLRYGHIEGEMSEEVFKKYQNDFIKNKICFKSH